MQGKMQGQQHSQFSVYRGEFYVGLLLKETIRFAEARTRVSCVWVEEGKGCAALSGEQNCKGV